MDASTIKALVRAWHALDALPNHMKQATESGETMRRIRMLLAEQGVNVESST